MKKLFLGLLIGLALWIGIGLLFPGRFFPSSWLQSSQSKNLAAIRAHIQNTEPQWTEFQQKNPEFSSVQLFAYTGGDGMFGANGEVANQASLEKLRHFMQSTQPPRPIYVGAVRVNGQGVLPDAGRRKIETH